MQENQILMTRAAKTQTGLCSRRHHTLRQSAGLLRTVRLQPDAETHDVLGLVRLAVTALDQSPILHATHSKRQYARQHTPLTAAALPGCGIEMHSRTRFSGLMLTPSRNLASAFEPDWVFSTTPSADTLTCQGKQSSCLHNRCVFRWNAQSQRVD